MGVRLRRPGSLTTHTGPQMSSAPAAGLQ